MRERPVFEVRVVGVGVGELEDVPGAPGDYVGSALDVVGAPLRRPGKGVCDGAGNEGFSAM